MAACGRRPYHWAQRWHDDPPIGTVVLGPERVIYFGNGEWQPLDESRASS